MRGDPLDPAVLRQLEADLGGPEPLAECIAAFLEDAKGLVRAIGDAASRHDEAALRAAAHALKSASAQFGADQLANLAVAAERAPTLAPPQDEERAAALAAEAQRVFAALAPWRAPKGP